ncbi:hypothetical protein KEM52_005664 [Ascosphaera acerosa]|nr:hypothetical protein KEM52_005664 [Ascosphaera acerosa]
MRTHDLAILAPATAAPSAPSFTYDKLWQLEQRFWHDFVYPINVKEMHSINSTWFAPDVQGRVDASRNFDSAELNTEYVFGLFTDPSLVSLFGIPLSTEILKFTAHDGGNVAAASTRVMFNHTSLGFVAPVVIDTWKAYNAAAQIWQYDAVFKWMDGWMKLIVQNAAKKFNASTPLEAERKLAGVLSDAH